ncbi:MAG: hypothetical protein ACR2PT_12870 [Endozoicomonas sp.]
MPRIGLLTLLFSLLPLSAQASDLINLAHKAGFDRCDNAITTEFKELAVNGNGVASTGYFNNRSFNVLATWGGKDYSALKSSTFIKFGRKCLAYSIINTTYSGACKTFMEKNPGWEMIREQGSFTWTRNKGGVNAILKTLPNQICDITYRIHQTYEASTSAPRKKPVKVKAEVKPAKKQEKAENN